MPTATLLVRLLPAGAPAPSPPPYASRAYDTRLATPQPHECVLYRQRLQRPALPTHDAIRRAAQQAGQPAPLTAEDAERWLRAQLGGLAFSASAPLDMRPFAAYSPVAGAQIAALSAHGLPHGSLSLAAVSLFPPGGLYRNPPAMAGVRLSDGVDWASELRSPRWRQSATHFPNVPSDASTLVIIDVRELEKPLSPAVGMKPQGWAAVRLFDGEHVNAGVFQLPLYAGTPPRGLLQTLSKEGGSDALEQAVAKKQLKRVEWASVTVAILDAQRFGEWDAPHPRPEPDVALLPQKKLKNYLKTPTSKPLSSIVPSEHNKEEFMKKANAAFVEAIKAA